MGRKDGYVIRADLPEGWASHITVKRAIRSSVDNPFERYDLDPREGIRAITRRLKELAEVAENAAERERLREAWEELTLHPARRLRAALFAHPETRAALGAPPSLPRRRKTTPSIELHLRDVVARPSLAATLLGGDVGARGKRGIRAQDDDDAAPSLEDDPLLTKVEVERR